MLLRIGLHEEKIPFPHKSAGLRRCLTSQDLLDRGVDGDPLVHQTILHFVGSQLRNTRIGDEIGVVLVGELMEVVPPFL